MKLQQSSNRLAALTVTVVAAGLLATVGLDAQKPAPAERPAEKQAERAGGGITDGWITMKIHAQFITEDALDGSDIDVTTRNNVVTLTGTVATEAGRTRAVSIAKATDGVKSVADKLRIAPAADDRDRNAKDRDKSGAAGAATRETGRDASGAARQGGRRVDDGYLKSKVYSQFMTEDALENSDIDVDVKAGVVTLNGTVATSAARTRAAAIAKATDGVKDVKNALKVGKR